MRNYVIHAANVSAGALVLALLTEYGGERCEGLIGIVRQVMKMYDVSAAKLVAALMMLV